jgi:hypothetical protein
MHMRQGPYMYCGQERRSLPALSVPHPFADWRFIGVNIETTHEEITNSHRDSEFDRVVVTVSRHDSNHN